jgi:hypothetical protein
MSDAIVVPIRDETIRLGQLLKLAGVVDDGAYDEGRNPNGLRPSSC